MPASSLQVLAQTQSPESSGDLRSGKEAAFEKHEALAHTKDFRAKMGPSSARLLTASALRGAVDGQRSPQGTPSRMRWAGHPELQQSVPA